MTPSPALGAAQSLTQWRLFREVGRRSAQLATPQFHLNSQTSWTFPTLYIEIVYTMFRGLIRPSSAGLFLPKQNGDT